MPVKTGIQIKLLFWVPAFHVFENTKFPLADALVCQISI